MLGAVFCSAVELELSPNYTTHTNTQTDSVRKRGVAWRGKEKPSSFSWVYKDPRPKSQDPMPAGPANIIWNIYAWLLRLNDFWIALPLAASFHTHSTHSHNRTTTRVHKCIWILCRFLKIRADLCVYFYMPARTYVASMDVWDLRFLAPPEKTTQTLKTH